MQTYVANFALEMSFCTCNEDANAPVRRLADFASKARQLVAQPTVQPTGSAPLAV